MNDKQLVAELVRIADGSKNLWPVASPIIREAAKRLSELTKEGGKAQGDNWDDVVEKVTKS